MALDRAIPFERWDRFRQILRLRQGQHVLIIGTTGSGKTVLLRELLKGRDFVVVLGTKNNDEELYPAFEAVGYDIVAPADFDPEPDRQDSHVIFRPRVTGTGDSARKKRREAFETMLDEVFAAGNWTVAADELWTLTVLLGLSTNFEEFWSAGRSEGVTVYGATQEPVYIPRLAFTASTHLFLFQNSDDERIKRIAQLSAGHSALVREFLPQLPEHEFIYINTRTRQVLRSKVILGA
jgi:hypothetical protein